MTIQPIFDATAFDGIGEVGSGAHLWRHRLCL